MAMHVGSSTLANAIPIASGSSKKTRRLPQPVSKGSATRMLPQMPTTSKHRVPLIRRSDTENSDHDSLYSAYSYRPGAISAIQYNEDYNYAYQSTDSLNTTALSVFSEYGMSERRSKMAAISNAIPIASATLGYNQHQAATTGLPADTFGVNQASDICSNMVTHTQVPFDRGEPDDPYSLIDSIGTKTTTTGYYPQDAMHGDSLDSSTMSRKRLPQTPQKLLPQRPISTTTATTSSSIISTTTTASTSVSTPRKRLPSINATSSATTYYQSNTSTWADDSLYSFDKKLNESDYYPSSGYGTINW